MTRVELQQQALELPRAERQELAEALWDSLEAEPIALPEWQRELLDGRLKSLEEHPEAGSPWEDVEKRVWPEG
jgi:putative addiction module component (TIGR02574 family)